MRSEHCCFLGIFMTAVAVLPASGRAPTPEANDLERRLAQALEADASETSPNSALAATSREEALRALLEDAPDYAPARAELGEVWADGRWMPVEEAQRLASRDRLRLEYKKRRESSDNSPEQHARLAAWCDENGLEVESRPHWLAVLATDPQDRQALKALGLVWRGGDHVERELVEDAEKRAREAERASRSWERRLVRLEKRPNDNAAFERFREEVDHHAIRSVENRLAALPSTRDTTLAERRREIGVAFVEASENDMSPEMTASMCRIAVHAPDPALREKAANALIHRPRFDSVPMLLANLRAPVESEHQVVTDRMGNVTYQHKMIAEGAEVDQAIERRHVARARYDNLDDLRITVGDLADAMYRASFVTLRNTIAFESEAERVEAQLAAYNQIVAEANERVIGALERVTQESRGEKPRAWWDYWKQYTGYDVPDSRPIERRYDTSISTARYYQPLPPLRRHECFVAGTPVWTRDGQKPIETVQKGDLARDPHRGGLTYRVVTETTFRKPSPMVAVTLGGETIQATEGHPFWVVNQGWRMARQLEVGDVLSTLDGPTTVEAVEPFADRPAHNLVVESAANYYVGNSGVLVHDNTPRRPAVGLVASW